jgi:hypothetical protein
MALKVRLMGPKGGSRLRRGLRAAFRGSIVAFECAGASVSVLDARGVFLHGGILRALLVCG